MSEQKEADQLQNSDSQALQPDGGMDKQDSQQGGDPNPGPADKQTDTPVRQPSSDDMSDDMDDNSIKRVIEALVFASDKPLQLQQIKSILGNIDSRRIRRLLTELKEDYQQGEKSFGVTEVAGGFQFSTDPAYGRWLKKLYNIKQRDYLTGPSLETIAIVAYRQPITKADIEFVRGVNVDGVINSLLEKGLIKIVGKKDVVGRPYLYGTTNLFLQYFGINSLDELPALADFQEADLRFKSSLVVDNPPESPEDGDGQAKDVPEAAGSDMPDKIEPKEDEGDDDEEVRDIAQEDRPDRQ